MLSGRKAYDNIEEMAEDYNKNWKSLRSDPPYIISGSSFGCTVAYQIAQILHYKSVGTPMVILIDTPAYGNIPKPLEDSAAILAYFSKYALSKLKIQTEKLRKIGDIGQQIQYIIEQANSLKLDNTILQVLNVNYIKTWQVNQNVMAQYIPSPYYGPIVFFCHTEIIPEFPPDQQLHWLKLAIGDFRNFRIPGNHISMNRKPNISIIAQHLRRIIEHETYQKLNKAMIV
ncbi:unnamed protein product [Rotaria sp. Silwood2]|nr:unnamed protein product [Rotaria sp. Silwood2]CAF4456373.1 unnamed protein product [Rotaria sp. Silwood2]